MITKEMGETIFAQFDDGEDVIECYEKLAAQYKIKTAVILSGIGMVREAKLGTFVKRAGNWEYEWETVNEPAELVSASGNIMHNPEGKLVVHIHAAIAGKDHIVHGGHLGAAKVCIKNVIFVKKLE
jgi:predicted DNA-binding protein with PD1-like motif